MSVRFNDDWLLHPKLKEWLLKDNKDPTKARCSKCNCAIFLSNMGVSALHSHAKGTKHIKKVLASKNTLPLELYRTTGQTRGADLIQASSTSQPSMAPSTSTSQQSSASSVRDIQVSRATGELVDDPVGSHQPPTSQQGADKNVVKRFLVSENVSRAEILWCVQTVMKHKSVRSAGNDVSLFHAMFPDSEIASKMQLQRTKIGYSILFGLAPYFQRELSETLIKCERYVIGFDESLNKIAVQTQMDLNVRFWDSEKEEVSTRYLTSAFLERTRAVDLRENFDSCLVSQGLKLQKVAQVSMDGPHVNIKFIRELQSFLSSDPENPLLLNLGSCGLHVIHGAFKTAIVCTEWEIAKFLRSLYNFFKSYPARRSLYVQFSGIPKEDVNSTLVFPQKFCDVRWLENDPVAKRAIVMLPYLSNMIEGYQKSNTDSEPTCGSYKIIKQNLSDPLLAPKLAFFRSVALEIREFLVEFQSDLPIAPFLYSELDKITRNVLKRFVKKKVVDEASSVSAVELKAENLLPVSEVDLGYSTRRELRDASSKRKEKKLNDRQILEFRKDAQKALQQFVMKIIEKSPLSYKLTKAISVLDPAVFQSSVMEIRLKKLMSILEEQKWISGEEAEKADRQFRDLLNQPGVKEVMKGYSRSKQRLDHFWRDLFQKHGERLAAEKVMKIVMVLSHGNANLERGFSINEECLVENMKNDTLVAQRRVYDSVMSRTGGDIEKLNITKSLIQSYRNARSRQTEEIQRLKKATENKISEANAKKRLAAERKELEAKKAKVLAEAETLDAAIRALK